MLIDATLLSHELTENYLGIFLRVGELVDKLIQVLKVLVHLSCQNHINDN